MGLLDPKLIASLGFLFNKKATFQQAADTRDGAGQPVKAWANVSGLVDVPVVIAPQGTAEQRFDRHVVVKGAYKATLQGFFPAVTTQLRAVAGGVVYDVVDVKHDSQDLLTTLGLEIITT